MVHLIHVFNIIGRVG